ncbi:enolase C-terminal domain-like protein [Nonomuraea sp. NPDC050556]|uniref:enolase C-terminal domain-like protein n=1 Tax=Nonomuraea sp. NPDC050556 TaxID=3364369 RepID=UPI0037A8C172
MRTTDVRILETAVTFRDVLLDHPLRLAGATVDRFTLALVTAVVEDRRGRVAEGTGAGVLSVPWSWPRSPLSWEARDAEMRAQTSRFAAAAVSGDAADPLDHADALAGLRLVPGSMPDLAVSLAMAGVDNAVHDAWARAAGRPAAELYTTLTPSLPRTRLPVQHVVGVGDPLEPGDNREPLVSLREWVDLEGIAHVKVKLPARDPREDAARVADVHRVLTAGAITPTSLSLDPNEAYESPAAVTAMLETLRRTAPDAYAAVAYLEQPVPRDAPPDPAGMRELARHVPVLADEGVATQKDLATLEEHGWSGLVVKAAKGQSFALRSHAHARAHGLRVVLQDLTAVDLALAHSARLAATLDLDWPAFEYNSRQYAPRANRDLAATRPELVTVRNGHVIVGEPQPGLY